MIPSMTMTFGLTGSRRVKALTDLADLGLTPDRLSQTASHMAEARSVVWIAQAVLPSPNSMFKWRMGLI